MAPFFPPVTSKGDYELRLWEERKKRRIERAVDVTPIGRLFPDLMSPVTEESPSATADEAFCPPRGADQNKAKQSPASWTATVSKDPVDVRKGHEDHPLSASESSSVQNSTNFRRYSRLVLQVHRNARKQEPTLNSPKRLYEPMGRRAILQANERRSTFGNRSLVEARTICKNVLPIPQVHRLKRLRPKPSTTAPDMLFPALAAENTYRIFHHDVLDSPDQERTQIPPPVESKSRTEANLDTSNAQKGPPQPSGERLNRGVTGITKPPSTFCHLCIRRTKPGVQHIPCSKSGCRKTVCTICIVAVKWSGKTGISGHFKCPHCLDACADITDRIPQCKHYHQAAKKRRRRRRALRRRSNGAGRPSYAQGESVRQASFDPVPAHPARVQSALVQSAQTALLQIPNAQHAHIQPVSCQTTPSQPSEDQLSDCQSIIASDTPVSPLPSQLQRVLTETSTTGSMDDHASAIDAAIVDSTGDSSIQHRAPAHPGNAPRTSITPMQVFSELGLRQHVAEAIDIPALVDAIDGAIDDTIDNAIGGALHDGLDLA